MSVTPTPVKGPSTASRVKKFVGEFVAGLATAEVVLSAAGGLAHSLNLPAQDVAFVSAAAGLVAAVEHELRQLLAGPLANVGTKIKAKFVASLPPEV